MRGRVRRNALIGKKNGYLLVTLMQNMEKNRIAPVLQAVRRASRILDWLMSLPVLAGNHDD
jgi:hypothetical protein